MPSPDRPPAALMTVRRWQGFCLRARFAEPKHEGQVRHVLQLQMQRTRPCVKAMKPYCYMQYLVQFLRSGEQR